MAVIFPDQKSDTANMMPTVTFYGPDAGSKVRAVNTEGVDIANFTMDGDSNSFSIFRHISSNTPPTLICTAEKSSLSSTTRINVHGHEITYKLELEYSFDTPMLGKLRWTSGNGKSYKLKGSGDRIVGQGDLPEMKFSVFVPGDETTLDCLLAGWAAFVNSKKKHGSSEDSKHLATAFKIIGQLAGGGGGGGA